MPGLASSPALSSQVSGDSPPPHPPPPRGDRQAQRPARGRPGRRIPGQCAPIRPGSPRRQARMRVPSVSGVEAMPPRGRLSSDPLHRWGRGGLAVGQGARSGRTRETPGWTGTLPLLLGVSAHPPRACLLRGVRCLARVPVARVAQWVLVGGEERVEEAEWECCWDFLASPSPGCAWLGRRAVSGLR